jgi:hypothetical protein
MIRQSRHERNQPFTVRPELVEGDGKPWICAELDSSAYASGQLPSMALDSGILAGMTVQTPSCDCLGSVCA